jgi:hypothetical protein
MTAAYQPMRRYALLRFQLEPIRVCNPCQCALLFLLYAQGFEAGDEVEQFLVYATLAQTMK